MFAFPVSFSLESFLMMTTLKGSLLLLGVWGLAACIERASATTRHLLWSMAFYGILILMAGFLLLPRWHIPLPAGMESLASRTEALPVLFQGESLQTTAETHSVQPGRGQKSGSPWQSVFLILWLAGFVLVYMRFWSGSLKLWQCFRFAEEPSGASWGTLLSNLSDRFGLSRIPRVVICRINITPMTWGWRKPVIMLPCDAREWSDERLRMVLTHEMAHVRRNDYLLLLISQFVCAFYWFNPLVWLALRKLAREREHACDDHVLHHGAKASTYADHLLDIARQLRATRSQGIFGLSMARVSELEGRLISLLDEQVSHRAPHRRLWVQPLVGVFSLSLLLAMVTPGAFPGSGVHDFKSEARSTLLSFSPTERQKLLRHGVSSQFVSDILAAGYENPTVDQMINLKEMGIDPKLIHAGRNAPGPLRKIEDKSRVCMLANEMIQKPAMALHIQGRLYYGTPSCTVTLANTPVLRLAYDPFSNEIVDKAEAVVAAYANGHVLYFESDANLQRFNRKNSGN